MHMQMLWLHVIRLQPNCTRLQASIDVIGFGLVVSALLFMAGNALFGENVFAKILAMLGGDTAEAEEQAPLQPPEASPFSSPFGGAAKATPASPPRPRKR